MEDKNKAVSVIKKAQEDLSSGKISRREFNSIMMTFGAIAGYTLFNSFASAWTGTRMRKSSGGSLGYQIQRSLRIRASAAAYLSRTPAGVGNRKTFTISLWAKRGDLGVRFCEMFSCGNGAGGGDSLSFRQTTDYLQFATQGGTQTWLVTNQVFRDPGAWYHIVAVLDTPQATAANRAKIYINGVQVTSFSTATYPSQNADAVNYNTTGQHLIGSGYQNFDGQIAEFNFIDGQALDASYFGQIDATTGSWTAKKYTGTYGTNGFYLPLTDASNTTNLVKDTSGNNNNWTPNNISLTAGVTYDSMIDVPLTYGTTDRGNFAVLNSLTGGSSTTSNGNLAGVFTPTNGARVSTIAVTSGKWYAEFVPTSIVGYFVIGIGAPYLKGWHTTQESNPQSIVLMSHVGTLSSVGTWAASSSTVSGTYTVNDVIGVALNLDTNVIEYFKNGTSIGSATINVGGESVAFLIGNSDTGSNGAGYVNFGQRPFSYTPPAGFKMLHTGNLIIPSIFKPSQHFTALTYTGNGVTPRVVTTALEFQPDLVWLKCRSTGYSNNISDSVRGINKVISSDNVVTEATNNGAGYLSAFNSNGFSVTTGSVDANQVNASGSTYIAWCWRAGGNAVTNSNGSITSQVSANVTAGFSIVTYTGTSANATIGHGLGVAPKLIMIKERDSATFSWGVYHASIGNTGNLYLNLTNATNTSATVWNNTSPTSTVFSVGTWGGVNNTSKLVAYCFSEVTGYSKIGSYIGNGSTDGPFVYCGFRPRYILIKRIDTIADWYIYDIARDTYNIVGNQIFANLVNVEVVAASDLDIVSNGFKIRRAGSAFNTSGGTMIFMAFAEVPFKYANAR